MNKDYLLRLREKITIFKHGHVQAANEQGHAANAKGQVADAKGLLQMGKNIFRLFY